MGVHALWFDQPAILPDAWTRPTEGEDAVGAAGQAIAPQGLSCAGYGSVVTVTAAMGMAAANEAAPGAERAAGVAVRRYAARNPPLAAMASLQILVIPTGITAVCA